MVYINVLVVLSTVAIAVYSSTSGPYIRSEITPKSTQLGESTYFDCNVDNLTSSAEVQWLKVASQPGEYPLLLTSGEHVIVDKMVGGEHKYDIGTAVLGKKALSELTIRAITVNDVGLYKCQIKLTNQPKEQWPSKTVLLSILMCTGSFCPPKTIG